MHVSPAAHRFPSAHGVPCVPVPAGIVPVSWPAWPAVDVVVVDVVVVVVGFAGAEDGGGVVVSAVRGPASAGCGAAGGGVW